MDKLRWNLLYYALGTRVLINTNNYAIRGEGVLASVAYDSPGLPSIAVVDVEQYPGSPLKCAIPLVDLRVVNAPEDIWREAESNGVIVTARQEADANAPRGRTRQVNIDRLGDSNLLDSFSFPPPIPNNGLAEVQASLLNAIRNISIETEQQAIELSMPITNMRAYNVGAYLADGSSNLIPPLNDVSVPELPPLDVSLQVRPYMGHIVVNKVEEICQVDEECLGTYTRREFWHWSYRIDGEACYSERLPFDCASNKDEVVAMAERILAKLGHLQYKSEELLCHPSEQMILADLMQEYVSDEHYIVGDQ
jgi:hypothetical protein